MLEANFRCRYIVAFSDIARVAVCSVSYLHFDGGLQSDTGMIPFFFSKNHLTDTNKLYISNIAKKFNIICLDAFMKYIKCNLNFLLDSRCNWTVDLYIYIYIYIYI